MVLTILFSFLILMGLANTFSRKQNPDSALNTTALEFKLALRQKSLSSLDPTGKVASSLSDGIQTVADKLADDALKNPKATRLYIAALGEMQKKPDSKYFGVLLKSGNIQDRSFARLYASDKLSDGAARRLLEELKGDSLALELARVHTREKAGITPSGRDELSPPWKAGAMILVALGALLVFGLSVVVWAVFISMRAAGTIRPLGLPTGNLSPVDADRLAMLSAIVLVTFLLLGVGAEYVRGVPSIPSTVASLIAPVGILIALVVLQSAKIYGKSFRLSDLGVNKNRLWKDIAWGFGGYVAELPLMAIMGVIGQKIFSFLPPPEHPASTMLQNRPDLAMIVTILLFGAIIAPIWEEICFRGMMLPAFTRVTGGKIVAGSLITSFLFAAIHPQGLSTWPALMTVAAASCALAYHTRSLVPSIVMHALHNGTLLVVTLLIT